MPGTPVARTASNHLTPSFTPQRRFYSFRAPGLHQPNRSQPAAIRAVLGRALIATGLLCGAFGPAQPAAAFDADAQGRPLQGSRSAASTPMLTRSQPVADAATAAARGVPQQDSQIVWRHVAGVVGKNFRQTLTVVKIPAPLVDQILLGFRAKSGQTETLPQNAAFDIVYEGLLEDGKFSEPRLQAATVRYGEKTRRIVRYETDDSTTALVQEDGHGVALIDLGQPLEIKEKITSPFGWRIHPVFGDRRFHEGVDFGAPTGTPVFATTDGVIEDIGFRGNYGKYIRLKHDGHLSTAYAHLARYAPGLDKGDTVKRGDVIAYVGKTGVATGPHLYYEVLIDGKQIDPMKAPTAVPVSLSGQQLAEFQKYVEQSPTE